MFSRGAPRLAVRARRRRKGLGAITLSQLRPGSRRNAIVSIARARAGGAVATEANFQLSRTSALLRARLPSHQPPGLRDRPPRPRPHTRGAGSLAGLRRSARWPSPRTRCGYAIDAKRRATTTRRLYETLPLGLVRRERRRERGQLQLLCGRRRRQVDALVARDTTTSVADH